MSEELKKYHACHTQLWYKNIVYPGINILRKIKEVPRKEIPGASSPKGVGLVNIKIKYSHVQHNLPCNLQINIS